MRVSRSTKVGAIALSTALALTFAFASAANAAEGTSDATAPAVTSTASPTPDQTVADQPVAEQPSSNTPAASTPSSDTPAVTATVAPAVSDTPAVTTTDVTAPADQPAPQTMSLMSQNKGNHDGDKTKSLKYNLAVWLMPGGINSHFTPAQTIADHLLTDTASLNLLDNSKQLVCGSAYQVDLYNNSKTTDSLIAGGVLHGANNPKEDLATGALGKNVDPWKFITTPACPTVNVALTGSAVCTTAGTWTVTWTVTITNYAGLSEVDLKVIKHLPAGSLINGVDAQVWLNEWNEHSANHHLSPFPTNGVVTYTQTNIPGTATSATSGVQYDFKGGPSGDPETTVTLSGNCTPPPPPVLTPKVCTAIETGPTATNLDAAGWYQSDTRATGKVDFVTGGVRFQTTDTANPGSSQNKATLYRAITPTPLSEFGEPSVTFASGGTGTQPGMQVGVDVDGNGTWDGYLVGEPGSYGAHNWWVNKPGFNVPSGMGYTSFGSWADFVAANPNAKVIELGLSLGSGVLGDWTVTNLTAGCISYTFNHVNPVVYVTPVGPTYTESTACGVAGTYDIPGATLDGKSYVITDPETGTATTYTNYKSDQGYYNVNDTMTTDGVRTLEVTFAQIGDAVIVAPAGASIVTIDGVKYAQWTHTFTKVAACPTPTPTPTPPTTTTSNGGANTGGFGHQPGATSASANSSMALAGGIGGLFAAIVAAIIGMFLFIPRKRNRNDGGVEAA